MSVVEGQRATALFDYRGLTDEELNFYEGDHFIVLDDSHEEWILVRFLNDVDASGYVPRTYIKLVDHNNNKRNSLSLNINNKKGSYGSINNSKDKSNETVNTPVSNKRNSKNVVVSSNEEFIFKKHSSINTNNEYQQNHSNQSILETEEYITQKLPKQNPTNVSLVEPHEEEEEEDENSSNNSSSSENDSEDSSDEDYILNQEKRQKLFQKKKLLQQKQRQKLFQDVNMPFNDRLKKANKPLNSAPPGYINSYLGLKNEEVERKLSYALLPQVDESGLGYKDLFLDKKKQRIRKRSSKCVVAFSLLEARNIPLLKIQGYEIIERRVRMSLFDKSNVLSNIHTVEGIFNPAQEKKWRFSTKTSLLFPKDDLNTCFVRTNEVDMNLSLLFEISVLIKRLPDAAKINSASIVEVSGGWGVLPLFTSDGGPIENRTYQVRLYHGSPFEKSKKQEVEGKQGFFEHIFSGNTNPGLEIRVWKLGKTALADINQLPDTCVSFLSVVPLLAFYRNILAHTLYSTPIEGKIFTLNEPALALLPRFVDSNQLLQLANLIWDKKLKLMKKKEKRSFAIMKDRFTEAVLVVWPLLYHRSYSTYNIGVEEFKMNAIEQLQVEGTLKFLAKNFENSYFEPFSTNEVQFVYG